jgi:dihydrofolate synthase/folylpolyglutamate synthase
MARIAFEKAGIAKKGVPLVTWGQDIYPDEAIESIKKQAERAGGTHYDEGRAWHFGISNRQSGTARPWFWVNSHYSEDTLPAPYMSGGHQYENCALAVAMIRWQSKVKVSLKAKRAGAEQARWPARMQRLGGGPLVGDREVWLDGGHNWEAGLAISEAFEGQELHLVVGMIESKQPAAIVAPLVGRLRSLNVVAVPNHDSHGVELFGEGAVARADLIDALLNLPDDDYPVLIAGSLYLAGEALRLNDEIPD